MSSRSWVVSSLVSRPETFCWVFVGRTPRSLMLFVGQIAVSAVNRRNGVFVAGLRAEFEQVTAGVLGGGVLRAGDAGDGGQPGADRAAELQDQRVRGVGGDHRQAGVAGSVPGADQAAQRPLRLDRPDRVRVGLGGVLVVAQDVGQAGLVPGDVLPVLGVVVHVPVGDHDAGERRQYAEVAHRFQAAGAGEEQRVLLGERPVDVHLLAGRAAPERGLDQNRRHARR